MKTHVESYSNREWAWYKIRAEIDVGRRRREVVCHPSLSEKERGGVSRAASSCASH